jgi:DNA-binding protein H-NS
MGLELQLEELLEQQKRAVVQHRSEDADRLQAEIEQLQSELAATAEMISDSEPVDEPPQMHDEEKLAIT